MKYSIPYGSSEIEFDAPVRLFLQGDDKYPPIEILRRRFYVLNNSLGQHLHERLKARKTLSFIEDSTAIRPLTDNAFVVVRYLNDSGVPDEAMSFLTAPGTHLIMTDAEI